MQKCTPIQILSRLIVNARYQFKHIILKSELYV